MSMRIIGHVDMDAFFASVEERDTPWLAGLPIVVGSDPEGGVGRGVVSTANYLARKYGIRSATPISKAWRLSEEAKSKGEPPVIFLTPDFHKYGPTSERIMAILRKHSPFVEEASIDEAYIDLSGAGSFKKAREIAEKIKKEIKKKEKITASIGIGPNKLVAKVASDAEKPDGLTVVEPTRVKDFLAPLPVRTIPGIGPKAEGKLRNLEVRNIEELRGLSRKQLEEEFGKWGGSMYERARGEDDRPLEGPHEAKSIGEQETFHDDTLDANIIFERLSKMCVSVAKHITRGGFTSFTTVVVTVRFADFTTKSTSHTLKSPANSAKDLEWEAMKLMTPYLDKRKNPRLKKIRLVGVRVEKLE